MIKQWKNFNLFSERVLVVLVSLMTLFLQIISFATTWDGAKVYLDGVFPYASLLFAIAIQATAYFFSNSLRQKKSILKIAALGLAICCSTYYSYIGIYNSVNSPFRYMQERYSQISDRLTRQFDKEMEIQLGEIRATVSDAVSHITGEHQILCSALDNVNACLASLADTDNRISSGMRAPVQSAYENYEDYAAAYSAYIAALSSGNNLEASASREGILASYGFSDLEEVNTEKSSLEGTCTTLYSIFGISSSAELGEKISSLSNRINAQVHNTSLGNAPDKSLVTDLNILLQAAALLGYPTFSVAEITDSLQVCAELSSTGFMATFEELSGQTMELRRAMEVKGALDSEILSAILKLNMLLPEGSQIDTQEEACEITDLYLIPLTALSEEHTRLTALFCLAMAGLVDGLSVLFAISLRGKKPLWNKKALPFAPMDERYLSQIYASLPTNLAPADGFRRFLDFFVPSPDTEADGYMLQAPLTELSQFHLLAALLCQINLAKLVPADNNPDSANTLLLKAGFVFWVNDILYQESAKIGGTA